MAHGYIKYTCIEATNDILNFVINSDGIVCDYNYYDLSFIHT